MTRHVMLASQEGAALPFQLSSKTLAGALSSFIGPVYHNLAPERPISSSPPAGNAWAGQEKWTAGPLADSHRQPATFAAIAPPPFHRPLRRTAAPPRPALSPVPPHAASQTRLHSRRPLPPQLPLRPPFSPTAATLPHFKSHPLNPQNPPKSPFRQEPLLKSPSRATLSKTGPRRSGWRRQFAVFPPSRELGDIIQLCEIQAIRRQMARQRAAATTWSKILSSILPLRSSPCSPPRFLPPWASRTSSQSRKQSPSHCSSPYPCAGGKLAQAS